MITLILNSRKRVQLLGNLLESVRRTVSDLSKIEILIGIDRDDKDTIDFSNTEAGRTEGTSYNFGDRPSNLHVSLNRLARMATGDYIFVLNDDVEFVSKDWDVEINSIDHKSIWYIGTQDNSADKEQGGQYSSFPILTRAAYQALGYFMSEAFVGLGGDVHLWRVFNEVGRIKQSAIELDHICHRTVFHVQNPDQTAMEMRQNSWNSRFDCWGIDISQDVERVKCLL